MANLPVEIIQEIFFKLCSPQTEFPLRRDEPRVVLSPVRTWILRSAQSILSFEFYSLAGRGSDAVADLVFPVIHRCSFLSLRLNKTTLNQLLALPPNSLCALRSIALFVEEDARMVDYISFRRCTSLQECCIFISAVDDLELRRIICLSCHPVVLPSLRTFHIEFPGWENDNFMFLRALHLPHLRKFQPGLPGLFKFSEWTMDPAPWSLSVLQLVPSMTVSETLAQMPNLTTFWLNDNSHWYPEIMCALSKGIIAPCLTTLHFGFVESSDFVFDILEARVAATCANSGITTLINITTLDRDDDPITINEVRLMALVETGVQISLSDSLTSSFTPTNVYWKPQNEPRKIGVRPFCKLL
ncbi:hypothetical protein BD779DRAFT_1478078 [Infundibulicybe gibba]|nr:hypothetical protein BD779DRAFT_1478078 [Infundibulicybe gibba]